MDQEQKPALPPIELFIEPGGATAEELQSLLDAISDLHVMAGGLGLQFRIEGTTIVAFEAELA